MPQIDTFNIWKERWTVHMKGKQKQKYIRTTMLCVQIVQVSTEHEQADYGGGDDGVDDVVDGASH